MSSDYREYHSPEKVNARRRAIYIREHAHHALAAVAPLYHAHLASSGLQDCGACGARLDVAAHDLLPAEPEATHHAVQH